MIQNKRSYLLNASSSYLSFLFDLALKIVVLKVVLVHLGPQLLGVWGILKAAVLFPLFLQDGISSAIFLQTARSKSGNKQWAEALLLSFFFGSLTGAFLFLMAPFLTEFFHVPVVFRADGITAFRITGFILILTSIAHAFLSFLQGSGKFHIGAILLSGTSLLNSIVALIFVQRGFGIIALVMIDLFTISLLTAGLVVAWFKTSGQRIFPLRILKPAFFSLLREAAGQITLKASGRILWESDTLLISRFFGVLPMAHYWIARRIPYAWKDLMWAGAWPAALTTADDSEKALKKLESIHWFQPLLLLPVSAYLFLYAPGIVSVWVGENYVANSALLMRILVLAVTIDLYPAALFYFLLGRSRIKTVTWITAGAAVLKVLLSVVALIANSLELLLVSTLAGALFFCVGSLLATARENRRSVIRLLLPLTPTLPACVIAAIFVQFLPAPHSVGHLLLQAGSFCALAYAFSLAILRVVSPRLWDSLPFWKTSPPAASETRTVPLHFL